MLQANKKPAGAVAGARGRNDRMMAFNTRVAGPANANVGFFWFSEKNAIEFLPDRLDVADD
jgi:hypothetical protein